MKIVTVQVSILRKEEELYNWFQSMGIHWHGYNGGGLDGKNSYKALMLLEPLAAIVGTKYPEYNPVVQLLFSFAIGIPTFLS